MIEKLKIAINHKHKGKHPQGLSQPAKKAWFGWYNGQFENESLSFEELAMRIQDGYGYSTWHKDYRKADNFICGQHLSLDFDDLQTGTTLSDILDSDPIIDRHAAILHTTPSHTPQAPRARVIFVLDRPIYNCEKYVLLATALLDHFDQADPKTKDSCRLFFGAPDCELLISGNRLTLEAAAELLVKPYQKKLDDRRVVSANGKKIDNDKVPRAQLDSHSDMLLSKVAATPDGQKYYTLRDISRTFGGYIKSGYYEEAETRRWLQDEIKKRPTVKSLDLAYQTIDQGLTYGQQDPLCFEIKENRDESQSQQLDSTWRADVLKKRTHELEALIREMEPTEPAWFPIIEEYGRVREMEEKQIS